MLRSIGRHSTVAILGAVSLIAGMLGLTLWAASPGGAAATSSGAPGVWVATADRDAVVFVNGSAPGTLIPVAVGGLIGEIVTVGDVVDGLQAIVGTRGIAVLDVAGGGIVQLIPLPTGSFDPDSAHVVATAAGVWLVDGTGRVARFRPSDRQWGEVGRVDAPTAVVLSPEQRRWIVRTTSGAVVIPFDGGAPARVSVPGTVVSVGADTAGLLVSTTQGIFRPDGRRVSTATGLLLSEHCGDRERWYAVDSAGRVVAADPTTTIRFDPPSAVTLRPVVSAGRVWVGVDAAVLELDLDLRLVERHPVDGVTELLIWAGGVVALAPRSATTMAPGRPDVSVDLAVDSVDGGGPDEQIGVGGRTRPSDVGTFDPTDLGRVPELVREQVAPVAEDDEMSVGEGVSDLAVLFNDHDANGDPLRVTSVSTSSPGIEVGPSPTGVAVVVASGTTGSAVLDYEITDDRCSEGPCVDGAQVRLTIGRVVNRPPVATPDQVTIAQGSTAEVAVLSNDVDPDRDPLTIVGTDAPPGLEVRTGGGGLVVEVADDLAPGNAVVGYLESDGHDHTVTGSLIVEVVAGSDNHPPVAYPDLVTGPSGATVSIDPTLNDSDPDSDRVDVSAVASGQRSGNLVSFTMGSETTRVEYSVADGAGLTATSTITLLPAESVPPTIVPPTSAPPVIAPPSVATVPPSGPPSSVAPGSTTPSTAAPPTPSTAAPPTPAAPSTAAPPTTATPTTTPPTTAAPTTTTTLPPYLGYPTAIAAGDAHSCVIVDDDAVYCWGRNDAGQLGNGTTVSSSTPVRVVGVTGATRIAAGGNDTCAIVAGGAVRCWGDNAHGQLGDGTTTSSSSPVVVNGMSGASVISVSGSHTCVVIVDGALRCWGMNAVGQLGDGSQVDSAVPTGGDGLPAVWTVSAGPGTTCAVTTPPNNVKCWGDGFSGALGNGSTAISTLPVDVQGAAAVSSLGTGGDHSCIVWGAGTGGFRCWGRGFGGMLGNGASADSTVPVDVSGLSNVSVNYTEEDMRTMVVSSPTFSCGSVPYEPIRCWGQGYLGNGAVGSSAVPVDVDFSMGGMGYVTLGLALGTGHGCAIVGVEAAAVVCWGDNSDGQLGDGTTTTRLSPVYLPGVGA